jgi:membrane protein DedA with SNARE-associated domain
VTHLIDTYGLWLLFILVALESSGIPLPGETALVTAGVLAAGGHLDIGAVSAVAAAAAIVGDNIGYAVGRNWGRRILTRWAWLERYSHRVLPPSERFFRRHGAKTVFIARFLPVLRFTAAWMAGVSRMPWWRFLIFNAAGGIAWATTIGLVAYYAGKAAADAISRYGLYGAAAVVGIGALVVLGIHAWRRRVVPEGDA